jgi:hypothetical protein
MKVKISVRNAVHVTKIFNKLSYHSMNISNYTDYPLPSVFLSIEHPNPTSNPNNYPA